MGKLINVGPWMDAIRRRVRLVLIFEELEKLEQELESSEIEKSTLERVRVLKRLLRETR
tara:strand:- start:568 stop:744 length:177 start_codon:yes stop_codon:yes gene_type:complete